MEPQKPIAAALAAYCKAETIRAKQPGVAPVEVEDADAQWLFTVLLERGQRWGDIRGTERCRRLIRALFDERLPATEYEAFIQRHKMAA